MLSIAVDVNARPWLSLSCAGGGEDDKLLLRDASGREK